MAMQCPKCLEQVPDDDVFCEACGFGLAVSAPKPQAADEAECPAGCVCGAGTDEIDEDGFCERCGRRARPAPEDHIEAVLDGDAAAVSDRGVRHDRNEDRFAIRRTERGYVMAVCDGVSSSRRSEEASGMAATVIAQALVAGREVTQAIASAQAEMVASAMRWSDESSPSTTAVAALVEDGVARIGWAGDSRAYWVDADGAHQLTRDHSWINAVVERGEMTEAEASKAPQAHGITRWLGADSGMNAEPDATEYRFEGAGVFLLCSDGLWNYAADEAAMTRVVREAVAQDADALTTARRLVQFAVQAGGHDNVTVAVLRVGAEEGQPGEKHG